MQKETKPTKRKPLGKPIDWSDESLITLARVTQADLEAAQALWQNEAPRPLKNLLNATVEEVNHGE